MAHIPDLVSYDYYPGGPEALAIGWLDASQAFATGICPRDVRDRLDELSREPVRLMRGYHYCQFCWDTAPRPTHLKPDLRLMEEPHVARGNGEIRITAPHGTNYVAPALVVHYLDEHGYLPPLAFIAAVREGSATSLSGEG